jgi:tetratricopeptide (TPR) repeat protein
MNGIPLPDAAPSRRCPPLGPPFVSSAPAPNRAEVPAGARPPLGSGASSTSNTSSAQTRFVLQPPAASAAQVLAHEALMQLAAGRPKAARDAARAALDAGPVDPAMYILRARAYRQEGRLRRAQRAVDAALRRAPDDFEALLLRAELLRQRGQAALALNALRDLASRHPTPEVRLELARALRSSGDAEAAVAELNAIVRGHPDETASGLYHVELLIDLGDWTAAKERITRLWLEMPDDRRLRLLRAEVGRRAGATHPAPGPQAQRAAARRAVADYNAVLVQDPEDTEALAGRAEALMQADDSGPAQRDAQAALELAPHHPVAWLALGHYHLSRGQLRRAGAAYARAYRYGADVRARVGEAMALRRQRRFDDALRLLEGVPPPAPGIVAQQLGITLLACKQYDRAIEALTRALDSEPNDEAALACRGEARRKLHAFNDALDDYEAALAINPANVMARKGHATADRSRRRRRLFLPGGR